MTIQQIEKEIRLKINNLYAVVFALSRYDRKQLKEKEDLLIENICSKIIELLEEVKKVVPEERKDNGLMTEQYAFGKKDGFNFCRTEVLTNLDDLIDNIKK